MDPNETAQKLLYLDTFHEVKRKRDKKKETAGVQGRGGRGSRANYFTSSSKDAGVARNTSARRDNWVNHTSDRGSAPLPDIRKWKIMQLLAQKKQPPLYQMALQLYPMGAPVMDPNCLAMTLMVKLKMAYLRTSQQLFQCNQMLLSLLPPFLLHHLSL